MATLTAYFWWIPVLALTAVVVGLYVAMALTTWVLGRWIDHRRHRFG